jgi:nucleoside 2-deoxyribosyltransferase
MTRLYLSVSLRRAAFAEWVDRELSRHGYEVLNPCRLDLPDGPKEHYPEWVAASCYGMIDRADAVVLLADYYGRDCAAEIGYAYAGGRPVIGLMSDAQEPSLLDQDWMLRPIVSRVAGSIAELLTALEETAFPRSPRTSTARHRSAAQEARSVPAPATR